MSIIKMDTYIGSGLGNCFPGSFAFTWEPRKLFDTIKGIKNFRGRTPKKLGLDSLGI